MNNEDLHQYVLENLGDSYKLVINPLDFGVARFRFELSIKVRSGYKIFKTIYANTYEDLVDILENTYD